MVMVSERKHCDLFILQRIKATAYAVNVCNCCNFHGKAVFKGELETKVKTSTEEVKNTYIAPNHKFVSEGFTVCNLSLDPQKHFPKYHSAE